MLKHLDDKGDLSLLLGDDGSILLVCSKCRKVWSGQLELSEVTPETTKAERRHVGNMLSDLRIEDPVFMKEMGLDAINLTDLD